MSPAQCHALRRLAAADGPIRLHSGTANALEARQYAERADGGWIITSHGRAVVDNEAIAARHREVQARLSPADHEWAARVVAWMKALERFDAWVVLRHAEHLAACRHAGVEPAPPEYGAFAEELLARVRAEVEDADAILRAYDDAANLAAARGVGVTVEFEAAPREPRARPDAVDAARRSDGVVALTTYRERRPAPPKGGAA